MDKYIDNYFENRYKFPHLNTKKKQNQNPIISIDNI